MLIFRTGKPFFVRTIQCVIENIYVQVCKNSITNHDLPIGSKDRKRAIGMYAHIEIGLCTELIISPIEAIPQYSSCRNHVLFHGVVIMISTNFIFMRVMSSTSFRV